MRKLRYTARCVDKLKKDHCWDQQVIGVFDSDQQVGQYIYGYSSDVPFYAFEQDGHWFALMSGENYTKTDIISLPSCAVIGPGEPLVPHGGGFCPVEFYVPAYTRHSYQQTPETGQQLAAPREAWVRLYDDADFTADETETKSWEPWIYEPFGFRSGCIWGDDSSWKLQLLDLSDARNGTVKQIDIGYIELAPYSLRECLSFTDDGDDGIDGVRVKMQVYHELSEPLQQLGIRVLQERAGG